MYRLGKTSGDRPNFVDRHFVQSSLSPPNIFESRNLVNHNSINQNLVEQNLTPLVFDRQHFVDHTLNGKHLTSPFFGASNFDVLHTDQDELALYEIEARSDSESNWDRYNADTFDFCRRRRLCALSSSGVAVVVAVVVATCGQSKSSQHLLGLVYT
jgi:hypothetical protein